MTPELRWLRFNAPIMSDRERGMHAADGRESRTLCGLLSISDRWRSQDFDGTLPALEERATLARNPRVCEACRAKLTPPGDGDASTRDR